MKVTDLRGTDGKSLPKSFQKSLAKLVECGKILAEYPDDGKVTQTNPYSGVSVELSPVAGAIARWIVSYNPIQGKLTRADWDNARYAFMSCWPKAYFDLID